MLFLLSLRFGQISPLAFFRWFLLWPRIGMMSLVTVSPVITAFYRTTFFDQVNLWPAWVGFETAIFWQCSPGTVETQRLYPLRHGPRRNNNNEKKKSPQLIRIDSRYKFKKKRNLNLSFSWTLYTNFYINLMCLKDSRVSFRYIYIKNNFYFKEGYVYFCIGLYIYIYIYKVIHRQICFVLSELISVARHTSFP